MRSSDDMVPSSSASQSDKADQLGEGSRAMGDNSRAEGRCDLRPIMAPLRRTKRNPPPDPLTLGRGIKEDDEAAWVLEPETPWTDEREGRRWRSWYLFKPGRHELARDTR